MSGEFTNDDFLLALREAQESAPAQGPGSFAEWKQENFTKAQGPAPYSPGFGLMGGHLNTSSRAPVGPNYRPSGNSAVGLRQWPQQFGVPSGSEAPQGQSQYAGARPNQPPPWISDVDMGSVAYSPMEPVWPFGPPYYNVPREWNYPVGYNLNYVPARLNLMGMLRGMRKSWGVLSTVIETRKDQLLRIPWTIQVRNKPRQTSKHVDEVRHFFKRPDGKLSYNQWMGRLLDDSLVIDAPTLYLDRDLGGRLTKAQLLDGATIFPLIDDSGRRPDTDYSVDRNGLTYERRQPAFQQIIYGLPMINLSEDEIIYAMRRPLPELPVFGYSAVEQILTETTEAIRKTFFQLEHWRSGSIPELIMTVPDSWCYSDDTEVLTRKGWKRFTEVDINVDEFATRNNFSHSFEWQKADGINISSYLGEMVHLHSKCIDCLVNPSHRVLISWSGPDNKPSYEKIVPARDLLRKHNDRERIPITSNWQDGVEILAKTFEPDQNRGGPITVNMSGDQFCAFMGMWLADGYTSSNEACITQTPKGAGYVIFEEILTSILGKTVRRNKDSFAIGCGALVDYLKQFGTASEKFIPDEIMNASARQIQIFYDCFVLCDASADKRVLYTSSYKMAGQLQELVQKLGMSATISKDDRRGRQIWNNDHFVTTNYINYIISTSTTEVRKFSVSSEEYIGKICCVSVQNGILYVRRNGKPCWSGNSPRQIATYQAHFDALLSGQLTLKSKVRFVPGGMKPFDIKNANGEGLWSQRDELLVRLCCFAFSVSPTPFIHQSNRATANVAAQSAAEEGLYPLMSFTKDDIMDTIIQEKFGYDDIEFVYLPRPEPDQEKQAKIHDMRIKNSTFNINEAREELGLEPIEDGDVHLVFTSTGVVRLDQIISGEVLGQDEGGTPVEPSVAAGNTHPAAPKGRSVGPIRGPARPSEATSSPPSPTPMHKITGKGIAEAARSAERKPSEAKKKIGNYPKGHISLHGLSITIENAKGSKREEKDREGKTLGVKMPAAYGYIRGTIGADGMQVDCYLGKKPASPLVWVIDQDKFNPEGKDKGFDEHKVMLAYTKPGRAIKDYLRSHFDGLGHERLSAITQLTYAELKKWLKDGDMNKPISEQGVGEVVGRRGKGGGISKNDTVSQGTGLLNYDMRSASAKPKAKKKVKAKRDLGPRWLSLCA